MIWAIFKKTTVGPETDRFPPLGAHFFEPFRVFKMASRFPAQDLQTRSGPSFGAHSDELLSFTCCTVLFKKMAHRKNKSAPRKRSRRPISGHFVTPAYSRNTTGGTAGPVQGVDGTEVPFPTRRVSEN